MKGFGLDFRCVVRVARWPHARTENAKIGVCSCSESRVVLCFVSRSEMVGRRQTWVRVYETREFVGE